MDTDLPLNPALPAADIQTCLKVLRAIQADRAQLTQLPQQLRRELLMLAGLVAKPERHDLVRMAKAFRRADRAAARERDRQIIRQTGLRVQRRATRYTPLWLPEPQDTSDGAAQPALGRALNCYVCKRPFTLPHRYYDSLCRDCGDFNYAQREQTADLSGHYALVTGARVKIGYQAALNMMTRTSAPDYLRDGIHMNAVDTGWVTDEDPAVHAARKAELGFAPPLDIIDGAARIVDPIFESNRTGHHLWGQFLKDYKPAPW